MEFCVDFTAHPGSLFGRAGTPTGVTEREIAEGNPLRPGVRRSTSPKKGGRQGGMGKGNIWTYGA